MAATLSSTHGAAKLGGLLLWAASLYAALQLHRMDDTLGHAICGPWGCGPPVAALLGYHLFWLVLILPLAALGGAKLPAALAATWGDRIAVVAAVALGLLVLVDGVEYFRQAGSAEYLLQRGCFRLATCVEFPLVACLLAGLLMKWQAKPPAAAKTSTTREERL